MFGLSSVRYGSFSVRVNFRSIISGLSSGRISVRIIRVGSLLPGLSIVNLPGLKPNCLSEISIPALNLLSITRSYNFIV